VLGVRRYGTGLSLVALHGFTHTGAQFEDLAERIGRAIVAPDLPGHGRSVDAPTHVDAVCDAVATEISRVGAGGDVLGYSQGGRIALLTALRYPTLIGRLVLVSANAGIADADRTTRMAADRRTADRIRAVGVAEFLQEWTATGLTSTTHLPAATRAADLALRFDNSAEGLARAVEGYGQGGQPSCWDRLDEVTIPVLVVTGASDARYTDIGERIAAGIPHARHEVVPGAGHNPMLDAPAAFAAVVSGFFDRPG
jgi:2-succinyl-6-hydroxy-2,4-cyclohexadiene-1-carboxylate synthase